MHIMLIHTTLYGEVISFHPGLVSIASYINARTRHSASIVDFSFRREQWKAYLKERIESDKPDVIGLYTSTTFMLAVERVIDEIKKNYRLPIIAGGHHATIAPEETLLKYDFEALCVNDGEYAVEEYLSRKEKGESLEGLKGIYYKDNGKVHKNPRRELIQDIESFPYQDWNLMDNIRTQIRLWGMIPIIGTRGCTNNCIFCATHAMRKAAVGKYFRPFSPRRLVQEVEFQWQRYRDCGAFLVWFFDQVFTADRDWLKEFTEEYKKSGLTERINYSVFARADEFDEERARWLYDSGCRCVRIGVESGDSYLRNDVYEKGVSDQAIIDTTRICQDMGMEITGFYMVGGPGETKETLWKTFRFAKKLNLDTSTFLIWKPYPNTKAVDKLKELGGTIHEERWEKALDNFTGSIVDHPTVSAAYIQWFQRFLYFYFVPKMIFKQMLKQKHRYFIALWKYYFFSRKLGISIYDTMRNFTYKNELKLKAGIIPKECL